MMRRKVLFLAAIAATVVMLGSALALAGEHGYVGVDGCKMCHKSEAKGDQYGKWAAGPHAKAYEVLGTEEAKAAAAELGLEGNPQELDECLSCHVTAHGVKAELLGKKYDKTQGVGCESCHGPGADYKSKKVMEDPEAAHAAGLVKITAETCTQCHNEKSPTFKGFDYEKYFAKVAHPYPEGAKGK
jgi:hypothetical protein